MMHKFSTYIIEFPKMKIIISSTSLVGLLAMMPGRANAFVIPVPEIDAGTAGIAIGLAIGVVALIREHRRKK
jgi:type IV secretory pathway TrbL component